MIAEADVEEEAHREVVEPPEDEEELEQRVARRPLLYVLSLSTLNAHF